MTSIILTDFRLIQGCDLSRIDFVAQFMTPDSLGVWIQRAGRAGRQSGTVAKAYLLVQPSVFQEVKRRNAEGEAMEYKKTVEDALREWVETDSCRRDVIDKQFNNPGPREGQHSVKKKK